MRYLQTALLCSSNPIMTVELAQYLSWLVMSIFCGWFIGTFVYDCVAFPGYINDGSESEFLAWYYIYAKLCTVSSLLNFAVFLISLVVSFFSLYKQFQYINNLKKEFALDINKVAFIVHLVLLALLTVIAFIGVINAELRMFWYYLDIVIQFGL